MVKLAPHEHMRAWVENWKRMGPELEAIKKRELRAMTEEEGTRRVIRVMDSRAPHAEPRAPRSKRIAWRGPACWELGADFALRLQRGRCYAAQSIRRS